MILTADSTRLDDELLDVDITNLGNGLSEVQDGLSSVEDDLSDVQDNLSAVQATADGKNSVIYSPNTPVGDFTVGDIWFDESYENQINIWNGYAWEVAELGADALDLFSAARGIFSYLDVHSLTAAQIASLLAVFHQITSQDGTSYWDLDTGEFHTENGEFTGSVTGSTITGSTLQTTAGRQKIVTQASDESMSAATDTATNYCKMMNQGLQVIDPATGTVKGQILQAYFHNVGGENFYGWYIIPAIYTHKLFVDGGRVLSNREIGALIAAAKNAVWADMVAETQYSSGQIKDGEEMLTGVSALLKKGLGIVTLNFASFSFASGTRTDSTAYQLPTPLRPKIEQDLVSTHNGVRFRITTDGFVRPFTAVSAATAIRGTFTYQKTAVPTTYIN